MNPLLTMAVVAIISFVKIVARVYPLLIRINNQSVFLFLICQIPDPLL